MNIKPCFNSLHKGDDWQIEITAKAETVTDGEIMVYGNIAENKWYEEQNVVIPKDFDKALKALGKNLKNLNLRVHCYGGSVFAGQAIVSMIDNARKSGVKVTAKIEGIGASMGSVIPQAADRLIMAENAMMMIHKPSSIAWGNADTMLDTADMLDKAETQLVALYMRRFNDTEDKLRELIKGKVDGSWLTADEALSYGLCDEVDEPVEMAACAGGYRMNGIVVPTAALKGATDKIQIYNTDGGEKEMIFNKELDAKIKALADEGKPIAIEKIGDSYEVSEMLVAQMESTVDFLTAEQVQGVTMLEDASGNIVLGALKDIVTAGIDIKAVAAGLADLKKTDPALTAKANAFDALVAVERDEAIKNGIRAKGETFNTERWTKILANMEYAEIKAQSKEWADEADGYFADAYKRKSRAPGTDNTAQAPDDCFAL